MSAFLRTFTKEPLLSGCGIVGGVSAGAVCSFLFIVVVISSGWAPGILASFIVAEVSILVAGLIAGLITRHALFRNAATVGLVCTALGVVNVSLGDFVASLAACAARVLFALLSFSVAACLGGVIARLLLGTKWEGQRWSD